MKPVKIISFNALWHISILCLFMVAGSLQLKAQCSSSLQSASYSIYLNGSGNNGWGFSIPKFDPSIGTLVAVDIRSVVSVNINFQLSNAGAVPDIYTVTAGRFDSISSAALTFPVTNNFSQNYGPYNLQAGQDTVGAGTVASPEFFSLLSAYTINDSITSSVAGFLGTGFISFAYNPRTFASVISGSNYNFNASISDTMKLLFTYYYCAQNVLAKDITDFSVAKEQGPLAKITWNTENEIASRMYDIEESSDGKTFHHIAYKPSVVNGDGNSNYDDDYIIPAGIAGKLYFRLKETDAGGYAKYSAIRSIELDGSNEISLYPNPANSYINLIINKPGTDGWVADIYSAGGKLVQRNYLDNSNTARIEFAHSLAKGAYFIRLIARNSNKSKILSFIVQ